MSRRCACCTCAISRAKPFGLAKGKTREDLEGDEVLLTHLVELVGEAASKVPGEVQRKYAEVPWPKIVSMRNRLIHGYDYVDYNILWTALTRNLPELLDQLEQVLPPWDIVA